MDRRREVTVSRRIRPLAICLLRKGSQILVNEAHDPVKGQTFYRPIGGGIEFGETAADAVRREVREELGATVRQLRYIGTLENIFTYRGEPGHEIVLVFDGEFEDGTLYDRDVVLGNESNGEPFTASWRELSSFGDSAPLYPEGLAKLLRDVEGAETC
jgi:8-oxo-dGTP pyrophosphatase MutT (NUDIX family)